MASLYHVPCRIDQLVHPYNPSLTVLGEVVNSLAMTDPLTTIWYRIQNVDYLTYLELGGPKVNARAPAALRPLKNSEKQYWQFEQLEKTNTYYIRSVADSTLYVWYNANTWSTFPKSSAQPFEANTQTDSLFANYSGSKFLFQAQDTSTAVLVTNEATGLDNQRWKLIPVTPPPVNSSPLPQGTYRIRSLSGTTLLTMPSGDGAEQPGVYAKKQVPDNDPYQRWLINPQRTGRFAITSAGNNSYLGCGPSQAAVGDNVIGISTSFEWDLQSVGGFAWSIRVPQASCSIGVSDLEVHDQDLITLGASDSTPSQVWFLEKYIPLGKDEIHAKREVDEGNYLLRSARDPSKYINANSTFSYLTEGTLVTTVLVLKYVDPTSAKFTLTFVNKTVKLPVADLGGMLGFNNEPTEFVLLGKSEGDPGFYICRPDAGYPRKVVSGRLVQNITIQQNVFAIDNMAEGEALQMWNLVPAT